MRFLVLVPLSALVDQWDAPLRSAGLSTRLVGDGHSSEGGADDGADVVVCVYNSFRSAPSESFPLRAASAPGR